MGKDPDETVEQEILRLGREQPLTRKESERLLRTILTTMQQNGHLSGQVHVDEALERILGGKQTVKRIHVFHRTTLVMPLDGHYNVPGSFFQVAVVATEDLQEAFELTNYIDHDWRKNEKVSHVLYREERSTSVGDVLVLEEREGHHITLTHFVVAPIGFEPFLHELTPA